MTHRVASSETEEQKIVMRWARVMQSRYPALENLYHVPYVNLQAGEEIRFDTRRSEKYGVPVF